MKIKPVVQGNLHTIHTSYEVDFVFENNITFINGDSGVGKSAVYSFLQELATENKKIKCFNYLDKNKRYTSTIKQSKDKLFVIDNADILLNNEIRQYIALDYKNQYVIIGRNPEGLMLNYDEIYELGSETKDGRTRFFLKQCGMF